MTTSKLAALAAMGVALALGSVGRADEAPSSPDKVDFSVLHSTEAGPLASLPWLHEGLRITYRVKSSYTPGTIHQVTPRGNGKYDVFLRPEGVAGEGIWQMDIADIDGSKVIAAVTRYFLHPANAPADAPPEMADRTGLMLNATDDSFTADWIEPAKLAEFLKVGSTPTVKVFPIGWKMGDQTVDAIAINSHTEHFYCTNVYDRATGLLLHQDSISESKPPKLVLKGEIPNGNVAVNIMDLASVRDLEIPWADEAMPGWVAGFTEAHFRVGYTVHGQNSAWVYSQSDLKATAHGDGWIALDLTKAFSNPPEITKTYAGQDQFFGLWAGPAALAKLQSGQVLDEDPITKMKTTVGPVDDTGVTIGEANGSCELTIRYDKKSGGQLGSDKTDKSLNEEIRSELMPRQ